MGGISQKLVTFSARNRHTPAHAQPHTGPRRLSSRSCGPAPSAQLLIVSGTQPGPTVGSFNLGHSAGILGGGRFTPIPWSNRTFAAAWQH